MISEHLTTQPQTKKVLAERSGYNEREVELLINVARLDGVPIVSNGDGYKLAQSPAELRECADRLQRRVVSQYLTLRALRRTARRLEGIAQRTLWAA